MPDAIFFVCSSTQLMPQQWNTNFDGPFTDYSAAHVEQEAKRSVLGDAWHVWIVEYRYQGTAY